MLVIALQDLDLGFQALVLLFKSCQLWLQKVDLGLKICNDVESRSTFLLNLWLDLGKAGSGESLPRSPLKRLDVWWILIMKFGPSSLRMVIVLWVWKLTQRARVWSSMCCYLGIKLCPSSSNRRGVSFLTVQEPSSSVYWRIRILWDLLCNNFGFIYPFEDVWPFISVHYHLLYVFYAFLKFMRPTTTGAFRLRRLLDLAQSRYVDLLEISMRYHKLDIFHI